MTFALTISRIPVKLLEKGRMMDDRTKATLTSHLARAEAALNAGRFDDMRAETQAAFAIDPGNLSALWSYFYGTKITPDDPVFARVQGFSAQTALPDALRSQLFFMLGKGLEDMGQVEPAFEAIVTANGLRAAPFNAAAMARLTDLLISAVRATPMVSLPSAPPRLVFVLGMPRSGTSLTAQMLGAHPDIANLGERVALGPALERTVPGQNPHLAFLNGLDPARLAAARDTYLADLDPALIAGGKVIVDKMPENYLFAWAIPMLFPDAQILHLTRDKLATCWSCFKNDFRHGHTYSYDWTTLSDHYDRHLALCDLARDRAGTNWHHIDLTTLTRHPKTALTPVLTALDLPWNPAMASPETAGGDMPTLSKWQVRQGIDPAIAQGWRAYEPLIRARFGA